MGTLNPSEENLRKRVHWHLTLDKGEGGEEIEHMKKWGGGVGWVWLLLFYVIAHFTQQSEYLRAE